MIESIVSYGLAVGAVYALIGITYNLMFTASRVFSFTSGMLGMLGGVLGAVFITRLGLPVIVGLGLVLACGVPIGIITELVTVRPVLKSLEQHLYVLSTLAFALMVQQLVAIEWERRKSQRSNQEAAPSSAGSVKASQWSPGGKVTTTRTGVRRGTAISALRQSFP